MRDLLTPDDSRDFLRALGALLLGVGVLVLSVRKDNPSGFVENEGWSDVALFFVYLIAAVVLYGGAIASVRETGGLRKWQAVASVFGLLFVPFALGTFVEAVGGDSGAPMNVFWIALVTAGFAGYAGVWWGVRFHILLGSLALLVAYLAFFDEVLTDGVFGDLETLRGLLIAYAIAILALGIVIWRRGTRREGLWQFSETLTAAGIAAVAATLLISLTGPTAEGFQEAFSPFGGESSGGDNPTTLWDVAGLLVSLALVVLGALIGLRGPVYVGAIGLLLFAIIAGQNLAADADDRENGFFWWPALLIGLGVVAIGVSFVQQATLGRRPRRWVRKLSR
jgi:hypothetical protein